MYYAIAAVIALILDQLTKYWVSTHMELHEVRALIPGVLNLAYETNTGAAFNFLEGARWFFVVLCVVFVAVVIYLLARGTIDRPAARWSAAFVMAGAVGNCLDRVISGEVVDMLDPAFLRSIHFPVFNVADIFITLGVVVFILSMLRSEQTKAKPAPAEGPAERVEAAAPEAAEPEVPAAPEAPAEDAKPAQAGAAAAAPEAPPRPKKKKEKPVKATAVKVAAPPEPAVESFTVETRPAAQNKAPTQKPEAEDFDLESILSEFREL